MSTNWDAVRSGDLDALGAAIFDKMAGQKDDPSSVAQEMADAALALIERCKAAEAEAKATRWVVEAARAAVAARRPTWNPDTGPTTEEREEFIGRNTLAMRELRYALEAKP
jgi:hypothetical protein